MNSLTITFYTGLLCFPYHHLSTEQYFFVLGVTLTLTIFAICCVHRCFAQPTPGVLWTSVTLPIFTTLFLNEFLTSLSRANKQDVHADDLIPGLTRSVAILSVRFVVWKSIVALVILCLYNWHLPGENNYELTAVFSDGNG